MARGLWIIAAPQERSLVKFHLSEFRILEGIFAKRKPWQCALSTASDENLRYLFPAT